MIAIFNKRQFLYDLFWINQKGIFSQEFCHFFLIFFFSIFTNPRKFKGHSQPEFVIILK